MSDKKIRCAIYTRKSTEEGLEQEFNSLQAQREACEAYIKSQKHENWQLLPNFATRKTENASYHCVDAPRSNTYHTIIKT